MKILYIDMQNIHKWIQKLWWIIDRSEFLRYMKHRYSIDTCILFMWHVAKYQSFYTYLQSIGYKIVFKETMILHSWVPKWNVDIDIAISSVADCFEWKTTDAFLATWDGDYNSLILFLKQKNIFAKVFVPGLWDTSPLLTKVAWPHLVNLQTLKHIIQKNT
jgi:uncharacterized LabA/DUF88 family protein